MTEEQRLKIISKVETAITITICEDIILLDLLVSILTDLKKTS